MRLLIGLLTVVILAACGSPSQPANALASQAPSAQVASSPPPTPTRPPTAAPATPTASPDPTVEPSVEASPVESSGSASLWPKGAITAAEAARKIGKVAIVCGRVASAAYAKSTSGKPTFLNFDKPYPDQIFTVVIWSDDRPAFRTAPEKAFLDRDVCIQGKVERYRGTPQITSVGGDVMEPGWFSPWAKDDMDCVRQGSHMTDTCELILDISVEIRVTEEEMYRDFEPYWVRWRLD